MQQRQRKIENIQRLFRSVSDARRKKQETPAFVPKYFDSMDAEPFCRDNPFTIPSAEVMFRMQKRM